MLRQVNGKPDENGACAQISLAQFPAPFVSGLEYGAPARGTWNIVHVGMLIPEVHQIFVCAANCLRGVVLTAAEMGAGSRFSTVTIKEDNVLDESMEDLLVNGVSDILERLPKLPPAVLVYTSCIHHFMGCDLPLCFRRLSGKFPDVAFTDCYMNPIMRKSGLTPDQLMRRQLYSLLKPRCSGCPNTGFCKQESAALSPYPGKANTSGAYPLSAGVSARCPLDSRAVNIIGNNIPTAESSDLVRIIRDNGFILRDVTLCKTYEEYQEMACSSLNISYNPISRVGGDELEQRLGQKHLYLPLSYGADEIRTHMTALANALGVEYDGGREAQQEAETALTALKALIGSTSIAIDYTATMRPLSLARLLLEHGFHVTRIYADSFNAEEETDFHWLQEHAPGLLLYATIHAKMRVLPRTTEETILAVGQKAAYFTGSDHFVNMVEGGGLYGFDGIAKLADLMADAFSHKRDARGLIQQKGLGCRCCCI